LSSHLDFVEKEVCPRATDGICHSKGLETCPPGVQGPLVLEFVHTV
jgi:hypothetical protein